MNVKGPWEALLRYWLSKHVDGMPPSRSDIDPVLDIPKFLEILVLLGIEGPDYRFQVVGSKVEEWIGTYLTGSVADFSDVSNAVAQAWRKALDSVRDTQEPLVYESSIVGGVSKYTTIMLPLVDRAGATEMILAGSFPDGYIEPGSAVLSVSPARFEPKP